MEWSCVHEHWDGAHVYEHYLMESGPLIVNGYGVADSAGAIMRDAIELFIEGWVEPKVAGIASCGPDAGHVKW